MSIERTSWLWVPFNFLNRASGRPRAMMGMPKPVKKAKPKAPKKPSSDPLIRARQLMAEHMAKVGETDVPIAPVPSDAVREYMAALGRKGGKVSGAKRMDNLTDRQRREIALKAARARWKKRPDKS